MSNTSTVYGNRAFNQGLPRGILRGQTQSRCLRDLLRVTNTCRGLRRRGLVDPSKWASHVPHRKPGLPNFELGDAHPFVNPFELMCIYSDANASWLKTRKDKLPFRNVTVDISFCMSSLKNEMDRFLVDSAISLSHSSSAYSLISTSRN
jgi:hypothetical protein